MSLHKTMSILEQLIEHHDCDLKKLNEIDTALQEAIYSFSGVDVNQPVCEECLKNCNVVEVKEGGWSEHFGNVAYDSYYVKASSCCDADIIGEH